MNKPIFYHNIHYKYNENEDMDEETFLHTIKSLLGEQYTLVCMHLFSMSEM